VKQGLGEPQVSMLMLIISNQNLQDVGTLKAFGHLTGRIIRVSGLQQSGQGLLIGVVGPLMLIHCLCRKVKARLVQNFVSLCCQLSKGYASP
jgi:hypothetical protein